tara:strand:- start:240 stop:431 length:192 start_codon:yes stop_codon:yes gene_type:complete
VPFESNIEDSRNKIDIIGAISLLPGSKNQIAPNIPNKKGVKKNLINLFGTIFANKKQIKNKNI